MVAPYREESTCVPARLTWRALALVAMLVPFARAAGAQSPPAPASTIATSRGLFEYRSAFWVNLHHLLHQQARARRGRDTTRAIARAALADTAGIGRLTADERAGWERALRHYDAHLAGRDLLTPDMARLKAALGDRENAPTLADAPPGVVDAALREALEGAAPAYRALWWTGHDAGNRAWVADVLPRVAADGDAIARELERICATAWSRTPLRVDASAYANWAGAYTTLYPDRITVATRDADYAGTNALEMLFHEALHTMDDSLRTALGAATARRGRTLPRDLVHAIIFFTAGEVTRRRLPAHQSYAERIGLWRRSGLAPYLPTLREHWLPWIEGRTTLAAALDGIADALP